MITGECATCKHYQGIEVEEEKGPCGYCFIDLPPWMYGFLQSCNDSAKRVVDADDGCSLYAEFVE